MIQVQRRKARKTLFKTILCKCTGLLVRVVWEEAKYRSNKVCVLCVCIVQCSFGRDEIVGTLMLAFKMPLLH